MTPINSFEDYLKQAEAAKVNPDHYWQEVAESFQWMKKWDKVQSGNFNDLNIKWFEGSELNITENCLDRHLDKRGEHTAVIFESNDPSASGQKLTYRELHSRVCQMGHALKAQGIKKGDVVCFYMGMVPELLIGVLACARIGAIHSVVFGGFSAKALAERINDCQAKALLTCDVGLRGAKQVPLYDIALEALEQTQSVQTTLVYQSLPDQRTLANGHLWLKDLCQLQSTELRPEPMQAEDPLFILYTSGSTGKPKGLLHTTAGYMVYVGHSFKNVFQMQENDIYWCSADIGWITGHSYLTYGPLLNGVTTVMFEGIPTWPDAGRFWQVIDKHQVTHFYTAPTAIRALEAHDLSYVTKQKLNSLKVLGTVGEPINEEAWEWYHKNIGKERCPIVDTWWQTETGGIMISPLAGITKTRPSYATHPLPGIQPILMDENAKEIEKSKAEGNLCIKNPWPSMARTIWGDHERYRQTYFSTYPGYYFTGDGAKREDSGEYRITGRVDDVINVSGHRIGTAEVEDAINQHPDIVESAVVGFPHDIKGQGIYAYVICHNETTEAELKEKVHSIVMEMIGPIAKPDKIQPVSGLPKTRSGKIMRRILRKVAAGDASNLGDTSTLLNPEIVDEIVKGAR